MSGKVLWKMPLQTYMQIQELRVAKNMTNEYKNQLKRLLRNLFQFDSADLDFGIYRIMNKKRGEIERFIEEDLIDEVDAEFGEYSESKGSNLKDEIEAITAEIHENLGEDALNNSGEINQIYVTTPFAKKLGGRYEKAHAAMKDSDMSDQHESEIFSHIYQFFSRYYDNGDFMSMRRYSQKEKYAIPYNSEEVVLHWANKDQYYIKTGENFKNYSFKIGEYTIEFRILDAESTTNNNKAEKRFFVLASSNQEYDDSKKILTIFFEYRGLNRDEEKEYGTKNVQDGIISAIKDIIPSQLQDAGLNGALKKIVDTETKRTVLEKHLRAYTKKNTTDYFIHKNLKGFLTQGLDFYIKNEVFHLDDLGTENEVSVEHYVSRVKVMKSICLKIIDFLAQIEDFQKMLFEKKKFVMKTDYCMTLDNVPEELYHDIVKNEDQLNEWNVLYGIGEEKQQTITSFGSESIDEAYLIDHPYLVLDTKFFNREFKDKLQASFDDLDESTGGLMVNSENLQALNLMQEKYKEKVKCIYIDPPYNTGNDEFIYKDNYQHSSWLTMMENRLEPAKELMSNEGSIFASIDDGEEAKLNALQKIVFGDNNFVSNIIWQKKFSPQNDAKWFSDNHDFVTCFAKNKEVWRPNLLPRTEEQNTRYKNPDNDPRGPWTSGDLSVKTYSAAYDYLITTPSGKEVNPPSGYCWRVSKEKLEELISDNRIWFGEDGNNVPRLKRFLSDVKEGLTPLTIWTYQEVGHNQEGKQELKAMLLEGEEVFGTPKVIRLMKRIFTIGADSNSIILDFFAGSGTTAHALLNFNREDNGKRKYILVEMGDYFDTILKPRIQKGMYSSTWKDGRPQSTDGISHIFKYQTLEQYEDTLNNIEFTESGTVQRTLMDMEGYFLRYMLDFETRESPCRFNVEKLTKPFDYTLKISEANEIKEQKIDLVETFNYLLGIHVKQIITFNNNGTYYKVVFGKKEEDDIAIIWRDTEDLDLKEDKTFIEGTIISEFNPTKTYINADFYVEGAHPIEPDFKKLMVV